MYGPGQTRSYRLCQDRAHPQAAGPGAPAVPPKGAFPHWMLATGDQRQRQHRHAQQRPSCPVLSCPVSRVLCPTARLTICVKALSEAVTDWPVPESSLMLSQTGIQPDIVQIIVPHHHREVVREVGTWWLIL